MKFALHKKYMLLLYSIKIFFIKFDRGWKTRSHISTSASSWQSKSSAALDSLLGVNVIEGMSFVVKDFLQHTKRSMFMNRLVPISSCSLSITKLAVFIILFN